FIPTDHPLAYLEIHPFEGTSVKAVRPRIPNGWSEADREAALGKLLDELITLYGGKRRAEVMAIDAGWKWVDVVVLVTFRLIQAYA
ncbi:hypothetical protein AB9E26_36115, partial [Rhizobium leguminosarum]